MEIDNEIHRRLIVDIPFGNDRLSFFSVLGLSPKPLDLEVTPQSIDLEAWVPNLEIRGLKA